MVNSDTGASEERRPTEVSTEVFMVTTEVVAPGWSEAVESRRLWAGTRLSDAAAPLRQLSGAAGRGRPRAG